VVGEPKPYRLRVEGIHTISTDKANVHVNVGEKDDTGVLRKRRVQLRVKNGTIEGDVLPVSVHTRLRSSSCEVLSLNVQTIGEPRIAGFFAGVFITVRVVKIRTRRSPDLATTRMRGSIRRRF